MSVYLIPISDGCGKFYYIPYRLFEFLIGGLIGLLPLNGRYKEKKIIQVCLLALLAIVMFSSLLLFDANSIGTDVLKLGAEEEIETGLILPKQFLLLATVIITTLTIHVGGKRGKVGNKILEYIGKRSYSIFIWHQMMIAFYRYFVTTEITFTFVLLFCVILLMLSELTYRLVEQRFVKMTHSFVIVVVLAGVMIFAGGYIYMRAGVVRDVPELDIYTNNVHRGMHAEYVDRVYGYDNDFPQQDNGKVNVLVEGVSYGRDMANVILESNYNNSINLSYVYKWDEKYLNRIKRADYIFTFKGREEVPAYVEDNLKPSCQLWGIGTKNYGQSNGVIYSKRFTEGYYTQTAKYHPWYKEKNREWSEKWGNHYIDFLKLAQTDENNIRVFTDDHKYISQDCYHLTQAGAKWYAKQIDFSKIFK